MLRNAFSPKMSPGMLRSVPRSATIVTVALVGTLWAHAARAQEAADLVTRMDRLEAAIRELTGNVEQLQYRNREIEQQLRRMQEATAGSVPPPPQQPPAASYPPPPSVPRPNVGRSCDGRVRRSSRTSAAGRARPPRRRVRSFGQSDCARGAARARRQYGGERAAASL